MNHDSVTKTSEGIAAQGNLKSYTTGFILSLIFTIVPYLIVTGGAIEGRVLITALTGFAVAQLLVQLVFFLHLGGRARRQWNFIAMLFTVLVVLIVVLGTLWVMNNLNYNMHPVETEEYLKRQEGF